MVSGVRVPDESPMNAGVAELADALDLGSSALWRGGSTPFTCTIQNLSSAPNMRVSYIGNTPAFQAGKVGSIPTTRSILCVFSSAG